MKEKEKKPKKGIVATFIKGGLRGVLNIPLLAGDYLGEYIANSNNPKRNTAICLGVGIVAGLVFQPAAIPLVAGAASSSVRQVNKWYESRKLKAQQQKAQAKPEIKDNKDLKQQEPQIQQDIAKNKSVNQEKQNDITPQKNTSKAKQVLKKIGLGLAGLFGAGAALAFPVVGVAAAAGYLSNKYFDSKKNEIGNKGNNIATNDRQQDKSSSNIKIGTAIGLCALIVLTGGAAIGPLLVTAAVGGVGGYAYNKAKESKIFTSKKQQKPNVLNKQNEKEKVGRSNSRQKSAAKGKISSMSPSNIPFSAQKKTKNRGRA